MLNLQIRQILSQKNRGDGEFVANVAKRVSPERLADAKLAVDEFLRLLPAKAGLENDKILFVVDGMRPSLYSSQGLLDAENSFVDEMRDYFIAAAIGNGFAVTDMQPVFIDAYQQGGSRFEFANDAHWNPLGHSLVAAEIAASQVFSNTFDGPGN